MGDDALSAAPQEEHEAPAADPAAKRECPGERRAYAEAARAALDRPIRECFPSSYLGMALAALGGLALVGALALAHAWAAPADGSIGTAGLGLFDLAAPGNASGWLAAMLLAAAALVAAHVYALRRHRVDDYHGRYRVWIWAAVACLVVSLGETTSLASVARGLCSRAAASCGVREAVVWPAMAGTLLVVAGLRLLVEVWRCRAAGALWTLAAVSFLVAAATQHGWLVRVADDGRLLVERGVWLVGYVAVLTMFLVYARHVALEIEGKVAVLPAKQKRPRVKKPAPTTFEEAAADLPRAQATSVRTDLGPTPSRAPTAFAATVSPYYGGGAQARSSAGAASGANDARPDHRPLSRSERRRLRREARLQAQD